MTTSDLTWVESDNAVTRRERRRQSAYREQALGLTPGTWRGRTLGNYLPEGDRRSNFLSDEAAAYAATRVEIVRREGGQLEATRLFQNMLSSMPLCFSVFGHLRARPHAAAQLLGTLLERNIAELIDVRVGDRRINGIECEWAPQRRDHLKDGSAFDAVIAARRSDNTRLLVAVETKYIDTFSRDKNSKDKDAKYRQFCADFGMSDSAFDALGGPATRQLLRNVLLTESVRRWGSSSSPVANEGLTVVFARDDDDAARAAVAAIDRERGHLVTSVRFVGHGELADVASGIPEISDWAAAFRRRYLP
jgi:hypothetical protein